MDIRIHSIGRRMPNWVREAFTDYQNRFPRHINLQLREINMPERTSGSDVLRLKEEEGDKLLAGVQDGDLLIAMDETGKQFTSRALADQFDEWWQDRQNISLLIGGPDGLSRACMERARIKWSLSKMTLPHMMVRVLLVEQLYRAWAITQNHPYHRD